MAIELGNYLRFVLDEGGGRGVANDIRKHVALHKFEESSRVHVRRHRRQLFRPGFRKQGLHNDFKSFAEDESLQVVNDANVVYIGATRAFE